MPYTSIKPILKRRDQILIVEDDPDSRELLGSALHEAGYSVDLARDGREALVMASRRRPDVVVSDLRLPRLDGLQLAHRMHATDPDLPVVLTTGVENTRDVLTCAQDYGIVTCLQKPMKLDELLWAIEGALAISRQRGRRPGPPTLSYGAAPFGAVVGPRRTDRHR
jgi:two-component system, NtrC family, response regulator HydG